MSVKINILGVDDKPENLLALQSILEDLDVTFISASSGSEALECLLEHEVALILMDVMMPEMDGYETAELIRGSKKTRQIPIIFISAINIEQEHIFKGYDSGAVDFLAKPINPDVLRSKVSIFMELYEQRRVLKKKAHQLQLANKRIRRQREALRESEVRFRSAFEQSFQFMAILDKEGKILELNNLARSLCGEFSGSLKGQYLWNVCWVGQDDENKKLKEVIAEAAKGRNISDEATFTDIDGRVRYLFRAVSPVKDADGEIACITLQGHDISKRVRAEQEKRELELLLQQAQKMEALGVLAGGIAHDFNNVLSVIIGNAELAQRNGEQLSTNKHYYKRIYAAAIKARDLVSQILAFSRHADIEKELIYPANVVMESIKLLRASIPSTIEIHNEIDKGCGPIYVDPTQYHQIIMNLCTNAFHALEDRGGTLSIRLREVSLKDTPELREFGGKKGNYVDLEVEDNGCGISDDCLSRIFDPYFTTKEKGKGTGMGLSIVHGIAKGHGGGVRVESEDGVGTHFHVYIPVADGGEVKEEDSLHGLAYGSERILLVDDEEMLLEMVGNMLDLLGYKVTIANSGREALELFSSKPQDFDLMITDQTMPGLVGTDLARKILRIRPEFPIILCTGYSPNLSREGVAALGIKELAFKPLNFEDLASVVRQTIDYAGE